MSEYDPVRLEIFKHLFAAIAEEMGVVLCRSSYSPNIKERRDYSCALFDRYTNMVAQAAHIPVHLGSMPLSVQAAVQECSDLSPGDVIILNDPFRGGTHLPDITLVSPVFSQKVGEKDANSKNRHKLIGFVASRAHHSDVGGMSPGSMPVSREIFQEGIIIPPTKLIQNGVLNQALMDTILANVRTPIERSGDLLAQIAANKRGVERFLKMHDRYGEQDISFYMAELLDYTERLTRNLMNKLGKGEYSFVDYLDDDGIGNEPVPIRVSVRIDSGSAAIDFTGTAPQQKGSLNAVYAITFSAVYYVFRSLLGLDIPNNSGCLRPIEIIAPAGSLVNAKPPAAVAGGNVETSQRIVDVLLGALAKIRGLEDMNVRIPAASQGTMNNITIGGFDPFRAKNFAYYETIGGGIGAGFESPGLSGLHSHMTNTLNTPVEAIEFDYPFQVLRYELRRGSGGFGRFSGGDGIRRDIKMLTDAHVTLLTERRRLAPYGLAGGEPGQLGENMLLSKGQEHHLPGKASIELQAGDVLSIRTPGGGGYGKGE
ncbi:MAG: hydantoinase B/oxoprolinase family protein [Anaerolineales bacterium]